MATIIVLYNSMSSNGRGESRAKKLKDFYPDDELIYHDVIKENQKAILEENSDKTIILCGGDGTLNHFINEIDVDNLVNPIFFYATGSGNDFLNDLERKETDGPVQINKYLTKLPIVKVNGKTSKFINGIGYGIDGYCCEEGDRIRQNSNKKVNYTSIAIKGLLWKYKTTNAVVTIDGVRQEYKKVWMAPAMHGRYYGGGMLATPGQDRLAEDKYLSNLLFFGSGKIHTLMIFPKIFSGEHVNSKKHCREQRGKHIQVEFDRPVALQIDGETVLNVTQYEAFAYGSY